MRAASESPTQHAHLKNVLQMLLETTEIAPAKKHHRKPKLSLRKNFFFSMTTSPPYIYRENCFHWSPDASESHAYTISKINFQLNGYATLQRAYMFGGRCLVLKQIGTII